MCHLHLLNENIYTEYKSAKQYTTLPTMFDREDYVTSLPDHFKFWVSSKSVHGPIRSKIGQKIKSDQSKRFKKN